MSDRETVKIIEALANGVDPLTGEVLDSVSFMKDEEVRQALRLAVLSLESQMHSKGKILSLWGDSCPELNRTNLLVILGFFREQKVNPTPHRVAQFLTDSLSSVYESLRSHPMHGCLKEKFSFPIIKSLLQIFFTHNAQLISDKYAMAEEPWREVTYFEQRPFERIPDQLRQFIREKVDSMGITLTNEKLSPYMRKARKFHPRSHEPWSEEEKQLLGEAMEYCNNTRVLSDLFKRGERAIRLCGQRLIFEGKIPHLSIG